MSKIILCNIRLLLVLVVFKCSFGAGPYTFKNPIRFPYSSIEGPFAGLFLALSFPLDLKNYNVFFSFNFEGNFNVPLNQTQFTYPPLLSKRSWDRQFFYDILQFKLDSHGYPGKPCLLKSICEASVNNFKNTGILGDLIHILLTPSTSINPKTLSDYEDAEIYGRTRKHCKVYDKKCSISFLKLISWIGRYI